MPPARLRRLPQHCYLLTVRRKYGKKTRANVRAVREMHRRHFRASGNVTDNKNLEAITGSVAHVQVPAAVSGADPGIKQGLRPDRAGRSPAGSGVVDVEPKTATACPSLIPVD